MEQSPGRLFDIIWNDIAARWRQTRPFVLGITGIDTSGKTHFSEAFAAYAMERGRSVQLLHLDDFHHPKAVRSSGQDEKENYYTSTFDLGRLVTHLLRPIREQASVSVSLPILDLHTDQYSRSQHYSIDHDTLVVFEGVFLFRPELAPYLDYTVFLHIPFPMAKERAALRDVPHFGADILARYDRKYLPAQQQYLDAFPPHAIADMIIDNGDWEHPAISFKREGRTTGEI